MSDTITLETQASLQDIRMRILNRERVSPEEMHQLLRDIARDRENASRVAAKSRRDAKRALTAAGGVEISVDTLFGPAFGGVK